MTTVCESQRTVFREIARRSYTDWPVYDSTPLYDRTSLAGLESDVRVVAGAWFKHDEYDSIEEFVCSLPLTYFLFNAHDCYAGSTRYEMETLFRLFVLREIHGWTHETALIKYLNHHPELCGQLDLRIERLLADLSS